MIKYNKNKTCRACLEENDRLIDLFNNSNQPNEICSKLEYCISSKITFEEKMPLHICLPCLNNLETAYNFKHKFELSQSTLQNKCYKNTEFINCDSTEIERNNNENKLVNRSYINNNKTTKNILKYKYLCEFCGCLCASMSTLKSHLTTHSDVFPYSCNFCDKKFKSRASKSFHLKSHTGKKGYFCNKCDKSYFNSSGLKYHMRSHSPHKLLLQNIFTCKECDKGFKNEKDLKIHIILHSGDFPYICDICERGFNRSSNYKMHLRRHSGNRSFICDICGFALFTSSALNVHRRSHFAEKPFCCEICSVRFAASSGLNRHNKRSH